MSDFAWDDLRYLLAIARASSLNGAARALGVNHSTVFRRLNALEEQLGVRLFERLPDGYVPTIEGEEIRRHAETIEASVHALERAVAGRDFKLSGEIRITTAPNLAADYLAGYVADFRVLHPEIRVEIAASDSAYDLARREADLALRATVRPPEYLVGRRVVASTWHVCASRGYLAGREPPRTMAELAGHALVGPDRAFMRVPMFDWMRNHFPDAQFVAFANDLITMRALTLTGMGIAFLPNDQSHADLVHLFPVEPAYIGSLWLLTHPDLRHVARIQVFMDYLAERLRADPRLVAAA